jgi:ribosome-binding ATPase YchF (GTP1/OBG family)
MKIGFTGTDLPEGKTKYEDDILAALTEKDKPKKVSPYFAEFILDEFVDCDAIVVVAGSILDLLILDMEKIEARIARMTEDEDSSFMTRCLETLESEIPLCQMELTDEEREEIKAMSAVSLKPVVQIDDGADVNSVIASALAAAGLTFFYTSGPTESHAWLIKTGSDILTCAGKIHTDLANGFIKGDVVSFDDYMSCHNFNDCRSKGVARLVDADYILQPGEVIEIRAKT